MSEDISVRQIIQEYRNSYPELRTLTDAEILSVLNDSVSGINLNEDEQVSMFGLTEQGYSGLNIEKKYQELTMPETSVLESALRARINKVEEDTKEAEGKNGFIGKAWSWTKNTFGFGDSSNKVRDKQKEELAALNSGDIKTAFKSITGLDYTAENVNKFLNNEVKTTSEQALDGYKEGQDMVVDITGDIVSGIAAVGIYSLAVAAAPFTGGASIAVGLAAATLSGGLIKSGVKALDAATGGREYTTFGHDMITGGFSGVLAPVTGGMGGAAGKIIATRLGVQVVKEAGKGAARSGIKAILTNPTGYQYIGGNIAKRGLALGTEMAVDGALGGAIDGGFRNGVEQYEKTGEVNFDEVLDATVEGGIGGALLSPVIGGGMKLAGKGGHKIGEKIRLHNTHLNFDEMPIASTKSQLKKIFKDAGYDFEKNYYAKSLFESCKTPEDFQKLSVIFNQLKTLDDYRIKDQFFNIADLEEADIYSMLLKNNSSGNINTVKCIKDNPLLREVCEKGLPILNGDPRRGMHGYAIFDVAPYIKTREQQQAVIKLIEEANSTHWPFEYKRGSVAKTLHFIEKPEDIDGYVRFINELFEADFYNNYSISSKDTVAMQSVYKLTRDKDNAVSSSLLTELFNKIKYTNNENCAGQILESAACLHESGIKEFRIMDVINICIKDGTFDKNIAGQILQEKTPVKMLLKAAEFDDSTDSFVYTDFGRVPNSIKALKELCTNSEGKFDLESFKLGLDFSANSRCLWETIKSMRIGQEVNGNLNKKTIEIIKDLVPLEGSAFNKMKIAECMFHIQNYYKDLSNHELIIMFKNLLSKENYQLDSYLNNFKNNMSTEEFAEALKYFRKGEISAEELSVIVNNIREISYKDIKKAQRIMGKEAFSKLSEQDMLIVCKFVDFKGKTNINEISSSGKKKFLRLLVASNQGLFEISDEMKKMFPLIPTDRETYCSLLPSIVRSLGIETNTLTPPRVEAFNTSLRRMSNTLEHISDTDFSRLRFSQDIPNETFIRTVLNKVKDLSKNERQKVFDYFGFELHHNKNNETGFSITGYPVNLNNGHKLAQITDPKTKAVVEALRGDVIDFSRNNRIRCSDPQVETFLNEVADALPEIHAMVGKRQHGTHAYDLLQHSIKVMQKIAQDSKFKSLNESDQKILRLAALMHDITKAEGFSDKTHAVESAFDTFFIAKKFNLTKEEEIKLYTLCKHHEWLQYVNTAKTEEELTKRLQSVAFDLQHDNLFDMAEIFTHADLRAVKIDDSFHSKPHVALDGVSRSYGESADLYAARIRGYVKALQKSQPLLPVTKMPTARRVKQAITKVNPDGSTNLKGVYQDKDGLVIIKYNETDEAAWVAMGLPAGTSPHGYKLNCMGEYVNTGNIKFFVHGLDYENQLAKFDAFSLVDSDVLLSVSYAERVESKYGFFRTQGVLLDAKTNYVHGGGNTDSGSGCGKFISEFKKRYIFGGERESDRLYISNLIKEATGMSNDEYVRFVARNKNRAMTEIEPVEYRDKIIEAFATINSNTRKGNRAYNEMYISNPEVMGVFAYSADRQIGMPVEFVGGNERIQFLKRFALERDLPFIVFGD